MALARTSSTSVLSALALAAAGCAGMRDRAAAPPAGTPAPAPAGYGGAGGGAVTVFPVVGDTSEVLSTIPEPVTRPRQGPAAAGEDSTGEGIALPEAAPSSPDSSIPGSGGAPGSPPATEPAAAPVETPPAPAPAPPSPAAPPSAAAQAYGVQLFASSDRARTYAEAERARRVLGRSEGGLSISYSARLWKLKASAAGGRGGAQALLARARRTYPKAFLVSLSPAGGP